jgi:hypothetical protein
VSHYLRLTVPYYNIKKGKFKQEEKAAMDFRGGRPILDVKCTPIFRGHNVNLITAQ